MEKSLVCSYLLSNKMLAVRSANTSKESAPYPMIALTLVCFKNKVFRLAKCKLFPFKWKNNPSLLKNDLIKNDLLKSKLKLIFSSCIVNNWC